jgi:hypothetical protein
MKIIIFLECTKKISYFLFIGYTWHVFETNISQFRTYVYNVKFENYCTILMKNYLIFIFDHLNKHIQYIINLQ